MSFRAHFACFLGVLFAVLAGVSAYQLTHTQTKGSENRGQPFAAVPLARSMFDDDAEISEDANRWDAILMARSEERRLLILEFCDGRMTLFQVAAEFKRLNSLPNPSSHDILARFAGATSNERLCRQVLCWLASVINEWPPSQQRALLEGAETALRDHLECNGRVILPGD
jgi:hypothetical protein